MTSIMKGDEAAFRLFYSATNGLLFAILLRILSRTQVAEEVLEELYNEVKRKAIWFNQNSKQRLTCLMLISHRCAVERLCDERLRTSALQSRNERESISAVSFINITEHRRLIRSMLNAIPYLHRQMIELSFFSGMNNFEIAKELGVAPEVVEDGIRSGTLSLFRAFMSLGFSVEHSRQNWDGSSPREC
jgi:DNA-directed RNA polymerase specialized sigma24 family protein